MATPIWPIEGVALNSTGDMVTNSLADRVARLDAYFSAIGRVYPTLAAGATIVSAAANWVLGAAVEVVPASTITVGFYIHAIVIESCSDNGVFEMVIYQGAGDTEVSRLRFAQQGGFYGNTYYVLNGPLVPANARIRAALASSDGLVNQCTMTISICYHQIA